MTENSGNSFIQEQYTGLEKERRKLDALTTARSSYLESQGDCGLHFLLINLFPTVRLSTGRKQRYNLNRIILKIKKDSTHNPIWGNNEIEELRSWQNLQRKRWKNQQ